VNDGPPKIPLTKISLPRRFQEVPPVIPTPVAGLGRLRKVAILGSAGSIDFAPWYDPSWEMWAHSTVYPLCKRVDRYFDLHPWEWIKTKPVPGYVDWLTGTKTPVYMQRKFSSVRSSVRYPRERVLAEFRRYFTSQAAWMMALALTEGVTHLGFFGVHYSLDEEHKKQRAGCEYWMGVCEGRGVQLVLPPTCPLLKEPGWLYGYESHSQKRHIREQTGGRKPQSNSLPPQDVDIRAIPAMDVDNEIGYSRDDIPKRALGRMAAQLNGFGAPLGADGKPLW
jgi:hypothetical protein